MDTDSFCAPSPPLRKRDGEPTLGPDSSALFVGRKGGKLWDSPPSANLSGGWVPGGRGCNPPGTHCPFHGARRSQSHGGRAQRGRTGLGTITALSWQLPAHTHTHAQAHSLMQTQNTLPAATHTLAHTCKYTSTPPGHSAVYPLPGREIHTCGTRPDPPTCPSDPLGHPARPMPKAWGHPSSPHH